MHNQKNLIILIVLVLILVWIFCINILGIESQELADFGSYMSFVVGGIATYYVFATYQAQKEENQSLQKESEKRALREYIMMFEKHIQNMVYERVNTYGGSNITYYGPSVIEVKGLAFLKKDNLGESLKENGILKSLEKTGNIELLIMLRALVKVYNYVIKNEKYLMEDFLFFLTHLSPIEQILFGFYLPEKNTLSKRNFIDIEFLKEKLYKVHNSTDENKRKENEELVFEILGITKS